MTTEKKQEQPKFESVEDEINAYKENIKFHEDLLNQLNADEQKVKRKFEIMLNGFTIINPVWAYERNEEYITLAREEVEKGLNGQVNLFEQNRTQIVQLLDAHKAKVKELEKSE